MSLHNEVGLTIFVQQPEPQDDSELQCTVGTPDVNVGEWLELFGLSHFPGLLPVEGASSGALGPYVGSVPPLPLTDGVGASLSASPSGSVELVRGMQLNEVPPASAVGDYVTSGSNVLNVPATVEAPLLSPSYDEGFDEVILPFPPGFGPTWNTQTSPPYPENWTTYSPISDGSSAGYQLPPSPHDNFAPSNEGFPSPTAYFAQPNSPSYQTLSPYPPHSVTSPIPNTPSPSPSSYSPNSITSLGFASPSSSLSSFVSPHNTTPDSGELILKGGAISRRRSHHDLTHPNRSERGRSPLRGSHAPSAPPSRRPSPYGRSFGSPNDPRTTGPYLGVPPSHPQPGPESSLMAGSPLLNRRHSCSAVTSSRPSFTGGGVHGIDIPTKRPVSDQVAPANRQPALPPPIGPVVSSQPQGSPARPPVASPAIIAACTDRRRRPAKFSCGRCLQTFTAKHNLVNHQKAHDGIKDQICVRCHGSFTASGTLRRHMKTCKALKVDTSI